jgi:hypothetical protein
MQTPLHTQRLNSTWSTNGGRTCTTSKKGTATKGARFVSNVIVRAYALRRCSSQPPKRNRQRCTWSLNAQLNPPIKGKVRHHCGKKRNKCQAAMSNKSQVKRSKGRWKTNCTIHRKAKRMHKYKQGWGRLKWKVSRGPKPKPKPM